MTNADVAIIGSGFAGLGMAIRLKQAGLDDFVVYERGEDVGGTWWFNTYPGCQCDIPSHLYSFSFALNPDWSRTYSMQEEIQREYGYRDFSDPEIDLPKAATMDPFSDDPVDLENKVVALLKP